MQKPNDSLPGHRLEPRLRVYAGGQMIVGWGKILLLKHVRDTGSIAEAARRMDISYNHAWTLIRLMNDSFKEPLVEAVRGGRGKGGASITKAGEKVLGLYQEMTDDCIKVTEKSWRSLRRLMRPEGDLPQASSDADEE